MKKNNISKISGLAVVGLLLWPLITCVGQEGKSETSYAVGHESHINPFDMDQGLEIDFVDGVPIFPWARPVVILKGSDHEMGCQYVRQLAQIFGAWILELLDCDFSEGQFKALKGYEWYIKKHAPEMIGFIEGMVVGAKDVGVTLTYEQVLAQFCLGVKDGKYLETPPDQAGYPEDNNGENKN